MITWIEGLTGDQAAPLADALASAYPGVTWVKATGGARLSFDSADAATLQNSVSSALTTLGLGDPRIVIV